MTPTRSISTRYSALPNCTPNTELTGGLSTRVVQSLGGWESIAMVERYTKSLTFDDALQVYMAKNHDRDSTRQSDWDSTAEVIDFLTLG
jgi:hypothetical protein